MKGFKVSIHIIFDMSIRPGQEGESLEYAVAIGSLQSELGANLGALKFIKVMRNNSGIFMLHGISDEIYFEEKSVYCVEHVSADKLVACYLGDPAFHIVDRLSRQVVNRVLNPTGDFNFNSLQSVILGKPNYLLCKDGVGLTLIDADKGEASLILNVPLNGVYCGDYTLMQYVSNNHLRVVTVAHKLEDSDEDFFSV